MHDTKILCLLGNHFNTTLHSLKIKIKKKEKEEKRRKKRRTKKEEQKRRTKKEEKKRKRNSRSWSEQQTHV